MMTLATFKRKLKHIRRAYMRDACNGCYSKCGTLISRDEAIKKGAVV